MNDASETRSVFILGGGASLGAHQVGAIKYLDEIGIKPDVLVCSSIGVINACVYGSGGVVALEEAWGNFRSLPTLLPSLKDNPLTGLSFLSMHRASAALEELSVTFEGAGDQAKGLFRPSVDCIMFTRDEVGFCPVCRRSIERVINLLAAA